jgi:hypothetical protein
VLNWYSDMCIEEGIKKMGMDDKEKKKIKLI